ncbi:MAG: hypothetical protein V3T86_09000 [Planctomycetota bacterium]
MSAFRWTLLVAPLCIAACAGGPTAEDLGVRPNERMILLRTEVKATSVELILSDRWKDKAEITAVHTEMREGGVVYLHGPAVYQLMNLRIEVSDELKVTYLSDHEDMMLYARQCESYRQAKPLENDPDGASFVQRAGPVSQLIVANSGAPVSAR